MVASLEAFKSFKTVGVMLFADSKKDSAALPPGVKDVRSKGGSTIPMVFVTTANGEKGIDAVPYSSLKEDARKCARELRKVLKEVDVIGGAVPHGREGEASENDRKEEAPEFHQWENSAGKTIKAAVTEVKGDKVLLLLTSGKSVWYDISKLSKASQLKLEKLDL